MKEKKENHRLFVTVLTAKSRIDNVLCKVFLPSRLTEHIEIYFYPTKEQSDKVKHIFEFSIEGEVKGFSGESELKIQSNRVYFKTGSTAHWGQDIVERCFVGEPTDLTLTSLIYCHGNEDARQKMVGCCWLTPSTMLTPTKSIEWSYTGNVKVETHRRCEFTLANSLPMAFDTHFHRVENKDGDDTVFTELRAEFEIEVESKNIKNIEDNIIKYLDDFLMLVSFIERRRCICLGWEISDSESYTKYYRRDLTIPDIKQKHSSFDTLIDILDFEEFIKQAYRKFSEIEKKDIIRQVIQYSTYHEDKTLESSFLILYSALETLMGYFRQKYGFGAILNSPDEWNSFQEDLQGWLKDHPQLSTDKNKRALLYEKIPELNRVSFSTVFKRLCDFYAVDLSDLWPVLKNSKGISLSEIRNKLIHGETFSPLQLRALMAAKEHLQWIMERLILAFFDWPISKSKTNKVYLSHYMACYKVWKDDQQILS